MRIAANLLLVLLALGGCGGPPPIPDAATTPPAPAVAATVNGEVILLETIKDKVTLRTGGRTLEAQERRRLLRVALDAQIEANLVEAALREAGLQPSDGIDALLDRIAPLQVEPDAVERVYCLDHGDSRPLREARFSMILVRLPPDAGAAAETHAEKNLRRVLRRIEGTMTFEEAAKEYSQDPSREFEGLWEYTDLEHLEPSLRAAVEAAPVGEVSGPIRTAEGWILLRVDGRRTEMDTEVGAQKAAIHRRLIMGRAAERREKFLKHLLEKATVEVAEDLR
ncbi:MAG: peptidylprolyl isomerase [Pseudomonadota bacterium]